MAGISSNLATFLGTEVVVMQMAGVKLVAGKVLGPGRRLGCARSPGLEARLTASESCRSRQVTSQHWLGEFYLVYLSEHK